MHSKADSYQPERRSVSAPVGDQMQFILQKPKPNSAFGVGFETNGQQWQQVTRIDSFPDPSGLAATSGLAVGDTVLSINGDKPIGPNHARMLLANAALGSVVFVVSRPAGMQTQPQMAAQETGSTGLPVEGVQTL